MSRSSSSLLSSPIYDWKPFIQSAKIIVGTNLVGCLVTLLRPHFHWHVDLLGTGAFALASLAGSVSLNPRIRFSSWAVMIWSVKLASFLFYRVIQLEQDNRLTEILEVPSSAIGFWIVSTAWGILCSLPHSIGTTAIQSDSHPIGLPLGAILFALGWGIETLADYQKWMFKQGSSRFCNVGLWSISQHPNWLGNLTLWIGIFIMNASALVEPVSGIKNSRLFSGILSFVLCRQRLFIASIGPLFLCSLFYSQATGRLLGDALQATYKKYGYGVDPEYTHYIDTTPLLLPNLSLLFVQWLRRGKR
jgi:protein-S-isoprenylcysteine O-methyltransferase Ste14